MVTISTERLHKLRRSALFSLFGLVVFVIALYFSFPSERAKQVAIRLAATRDLDVDIGSASPALGLGVVFRDIHVRTKPATGKPARFTIDSARIGVSPFSLLSATKTVTVSLEAFGGHIEILQHGALGKKGSFEVQVHARDVKMSEIPGVREAINMPLTGTAKLDLELRSDDSKLADSNGEITFSCDSCVLGDGKSPLKVAGNPFLSGGLTLPRLRLGDFGGHVAIEKGTAKLQDIGGKSPDGEVWLEGELALRDPLPSSTVNAYLRFKLSDAFLKQAATVQTILQMAGAAGKRPDGFYGMRLSGRLGQLNPPVLSPTSPVTSSAPRSGTHAAITPRSAPLPSPPPPAAPPATVQMVASAPAPEPAPPPPPAEAPPPPPPPPPPPAPPAAENQPAPNPPPGGWHGPPGTTVADAAPGGGPGGEQSAPPPPPQPEAP